jgi:hypothetical protein
MKACLASRASTDWLRAVWMASARFISFCAGRLENETVSTARAVNMLFLMFYYVIIKLLSDGFADI